MNIKAKVIWAALIIGASSSAYAMPLPSKIVLMWQVNGRDYSNDFNELSKLGVNLVQSFALVSKDQDFVSGYLSAAENAGIGVMPFVGPNGHGGDEQCDLSQAARDFIVRNNKNPAIAAWEIVDEPKGHRVSKECQQKLYSSLKSIDPIHPAMIAINLTSQADYDQYFNESAFDMVDLHSYMNNGIDAPQRNLVDLFERNHRRNYPVIVTLRAFNTPDGRSWSDMSASDLQSQYSFFLGNKHSQWGVGFYGWELSPNKGIKQVATLRSGFEDVMRGRQKQ